MSGEYVLFRPSFDKYYRWTKCQLRRENPLSEYRADSGTAGNVSSGTTATSQQRQQGRQGRAGTVRIRPPSPSPIVEPERPVAKRKLAPKVSNGFYRVPVLSNFGGTETIEWVRIAEPPKTPADAATGWVTAEQAQTPFFSTIWQPKKDRDEELGDSQLRWMVRLAQDRIQAEREDRRLQEMVLLQQRQTSLRTGLKTWNLVLKDCPHALRFEAPRNEMALQQPFAANNRPLPSTSSNNLTGGTLDTGRLDAAASAAASTSVTGQSTSFIENVAATASVGRDASVPSRTGVLQRTQPSLDKIRLLRLLPSAEHAGHDTAHGGETLRYSLEEFTYAYCPAYIALSYVWGTERFTSSISINGTNTPVRPNLAEALSSIAKSDPNVYLWVDAICINQQGEEEKSSLVQHMGEIFAKAKSVYAWLGPIESATQYSSTGDLFTHLFDLGRLFWEHAGPTDTGRLNERSLDLNMILSKCYSALLDRFTGSPAERNQFPTEEYTAFSLRAFWRRIWVLQEVFLAKDLYYLCGDRRLASKHLTGALILLESFQRDIIRRESFTQERSQLHHRLTKFVYGSRGFPEMHRLLIYTSIYPPDVVSLRIAMTNFCVRELPGGSSATDPRDMIFGLLGFANDAERSYIQADYSKTDKSQSFSVQETYIAVTRALIRNGFTDILAWAQPADTKKITNLPSWVPDYSTTIYESLCSQWQAKPWLPRFRASGRNVKYSDENAPPCDDQTLPIYGRPVDEIKWVGKLWYPRLPREPASGYTSSADKTGSRELTRSVSYESLLSFLEEILDFAKQGERRQEQARRLGERDLPRFPLAAKWRVPCCDQLVLDGRLVRGDTTTPSRYNATFHGVKACIENPQQNELPAEARPYVETLLHWADKRPILRKNGFVGLGPARAEIGDIVTVLDGFNACYLLRCPIPASMWNWPGYRNILRYRLIGEAYICDYMDEQMIGPGTNPEQWFLIR
ncbi:heterokaryon incompatibility protein-domain-containing protein [Xylaria sp. FL0064]|nr:heterokaryon incompatibility protein-domain-containing protein [Xylaria sp. FL0064]